MLLINILMQIEEKVDIVLASIPYTEHYAPLPAIAVLKSLAEKAGFKAQAVDLNAKYIKKIDEERHVSKIVDWFYNETYYKETEETITKLIDDMSNDILKHKPKIVGISVFTFACQIGTKYLCIALKEKDPLIKIVLGGQGLFDNVGGEGKYIQGMEAMKLIDHYFVNDAELTFYQWLLGEKIETGMHHKDWDDTSGSSLSNMPYPNFDNHNFDQDYREPVITITSSRGCVRKCKFCSDIVRWKKFQYRPGGQIFAEMKFQMEKYKVRRFYFTDPLINGNVREFRILINLIAEFNRANPNNKISYCGSFIFRPQNQFTPDDWKVLAESNPLRLEVGIESLDEDVRFHMGKKFNQEDLNYGLEQCLKYNILIDGNMIVGYPTETQQSINNAKNWLTENKRFIPIIKFTFGGTMMLLPGTWIALNKEELGIKAWGPPHFLWSCKRTGSTPKQRILWWKEMQGHAIKQGWTAINGIENNAIIDKMLELDFEQPSESYKYLEGDRAVNLDQYAKDLESNHNLPAN
jgi:anaerobic magnesium-protoporphyrin IX monomethyl ester cyclase